MNEILSEIEEVQEWLGKEINKKLFLDLPSEEISKLLNERLSLENLSHTGCSLRDLSTWNKNVFLSELAHGPYKSESGQDMVESRYLYLRIHVELIDHPAGRASVSSKNLCLTFLLLLLFNRWEQAEWLGRRIYAADTIERFNGPQNTYELREVSEWESLGGDTKGFGAVVASIRRLIPGQREKECSAGQFDDEPAFPYWEDKPLCGLVLRIWLLMAGKAKPNTMPEGLPTCGIYSGLFEHWDDEEKLTDSIIGACDYHLDRIEENPAIDYDVPEFGIRPYNVLPVEILALRTLRKHFGLSTPWPDHPLLSSVFVRNLPDELPPSENELIQRVAKAVQSIFPQIK